MSEIHGIYRDGQVNLDRAVDWPEGTTVIVHPQIDDDDPPGTKLPEVRLSDGAVLPWSDTVEFRDALLAQMDAREPVELTPDEEAEWNAARAWVKDHTIAAVRREMGLDP